jgi:hypothetical protein
VPFRLTSRHFRQAESAAGRGRATAAPRFGGLVTTELETRYLAYVAAFNAHDFEALTTYLDPDVLFEWDGIMPDLVGRDAFFAFYRLAWTRFDEVIAARVLESGPNTLTAWIDTRLTITHDWLDCPIRPYRAGEVHDIAGEVRYEFRAGRIVHIR